MGSELDFAKRDGAAVDVKLSTAAVDLRRVRAIGRAGGERGNCVEFGGQVKLSTTAGSVSDGQRSASDVEWLLSVELSDSASAAGDGGRPVAAVLELDPVEALVVRQARSWTGGGATGHVSGVVTVPVGGGSPIAAAGIGPQRR